MLIMKTVSRVIVLFAKDLELRCFFTLSLVSSLECADCMYHAWCCICIYILFDKINQQTDVHINKGSNCAPMFKDVQNSSAVIVSARLNSW